MTADAHLARPHVWRPGNGSQTLLLLHGTGADEHELVPLGAQLDPEASLLSPRGTVLEGSMSRFFRRKAEGVFDEEDLRARTDELADFLSAARHEYSLGTGPVSAVGFSNGANIASSLLIRHPDALDAAVLIAAMPPYRDGFDGVDLSGKRVAIVNGEADPTIPSHHTRRLADQFAAAGADVTLLGHSGGHLVPAHVLGALATFLSP